MRQLLLLTTIILLLSCFNAFGSKYITKTGYIYFKSQTDAIDIDGTNNSVAAILDSETGEFVVIVLIKAFELPLATAKKHFNDTYMESDKYPRANFKGSVAEIKNIDLSVDGSHTVTIEGVLSIHGKDKTIKQTGLINVKNGEISGKTNFKINIDDHSIVVPNDVKDRVAKIVDVNVELTLKKQ
jgi:predicted small secreted protein